jgi:hypothetical protein
MKIYYVSLCGLFEEEDDDDDNDDNNNNNNNTPVFICSIQIRIGLLLLVEYR